MDTGSWTNSPDGRYSVKSAYSILIKGLLTAGTPEGVVLQAVPRVWKLWGPSKVIVFSWQLLLDRIPSRSNLTRRGIPLPVGGVDCVLCAAPSAKCPASSCSLFEWEVQPVMCWNR